jgi:hypothetical protein
MAQDRDMLMAILDRMIDLAQAKRQPAPGGSMRRLLKFQFLDQAVQTIVRNLQTARGLPVSDRNAVSRRRPSRRVHAKVPEAAE